MEKVTAVSFVLWQGKNVLLLSSKLHQEADSGSWGKAQIIAHYSVCKGRVDNLG